MEYESGIMITTSTFSLCCFFVQLDHLCWLNAQLKKGCTSLRRGVAEDIFHQGKPPKSILEINEKTNSAAGLLLQPFDDTGVGDAFSCWNYCYDYDWLCKLESIPLIILIKEHLPLFAHLQCGTLEPNCHGWNHFCSDGNALTYVLPNIVATSHMG